MTQQVDKIQPMDSNLNFTYTTNPGGNFALLNTRQRNTLAPFNLDLKSKSESVFVNLTSEGMSSFIREILAEVAEDPSVMQIWTRMSHAVALNAKPAILRSDTDSETSIYVLGTHEFPIVQLSFFVEDNGDYEEGFDQNNVAEVNVFTLEVTGLEFLVNKTFKIFNDRKEGLTKAHKSALVRWYVPTQHGGLKDFNFQLKKDWDVQQSHYPWIKTELKSYYDSFAASRAQIIVLYGAPGTGKTTFIRDMICELNMNSIISYDLKVITSDMTFVKYLSDKNFDAIIIEDADELLTAERGEYNKIISKILNVSDGLIKLPKKKLILTTNLKKLDDLDPAIIRPGRCFDVLEFREFVKSEYMTVAEEMGLTLSETELAKKKISLAELFSLREQRVTGDPLVTNHKINHNKIGFV